MNLKKGKVSRENSLFGSYPSRITAYDDTFYANVDNVDIEEDAERSCNDAAAAFDEEEVFKKNSVAKYANEDDHILVEEEKDLFAVRTRITE